MSRSRAGWRRRLAELAALGVAAELATAALAADTIFFDGFEVGSTCAWSSANAAPACCGALLLEEDWNLPDGAGWPSPWVESGNEVALADVQGGRGRLRPDPSGYSLARMVAPGAATTVQALFTMILEDPGTQGVGFYARQNGGYLQQTMPHGQGYAVFVEAFRGPAIGVWREVDGSEQPILIDFDAALGLSADVPYRVRYLLDAPPPAATGGAPDGPPGSSTRLRARVWPEGTPEPALFQVEALDATPDLQGVSGGFAIDSWSNLTAGITAHTLIDDLQIFEICTE
ncbi:MAG: hypothetical protein AB7G12_06055 [Thermoanaerobaculia bacterium]